MNFQEHETGGKTNFSGERLRIELRNPAKLGLIFYHGFRNRTAIATFYRSSRIVPPTMESVTFSKQQANLQKQVAQSLCSHYDK